MVSPISRGAFGIALTLISTAASDSLIAKRDNTTVSISSNATLACTALSNTSIETQSYPLGLLESDYVEAKDHYWSAANADNTPACVVFPSSAQDVSDIVSILLEYPDVNFAVKSGGHNPNVGYSSVDGGVLISMRSKLANTTISEDNSTAYIGPGARWGEVGTALEPFGVSVVGGRIGDVGVGGYLLGGGLSFLSAEYGLACDLVTNYELVLADASIVNVNATSDPEMFFALKGGGNQYGIVTQYTLSTVPVNTVWGGVRTFDGSHAEALINATQDFTENFNDTKAAVIMTGEIAIDSLLEFFVVFFFYNGETPPAGVFDKFDTITSLTDSTKTQSYSDLLNANSDFNTYGLRYLIRGTTLPNFPSTNGTDLYNHHYSTWKNYILTEGILYPGFIFSMAFQPMPVAIASASNAAGINALGLDPANGDRMWMEYDISWLTELGDDVAHSMAMNITATIDAYAKTTYAGVPGSHSKYSVGDDEDILVAGYTPIFLNDAMYDQSPLQSYGNETYDRLKTQQAVADPEGFFAKRTGGFKFT